jgi:hypothetical protein
MPNSNHRLDDALSSSCPWNIREPLGQDRFIFIRFNSQLRYILASISWNSSQVYGAASKEDALWKRLLPIARRCDDL